MRRNVGIVSTWLERGAAYVSRQYRQALDSHHDVFIYARGDERHPAGRAPAGDPRVTWAKEGIVPASASIDLDDFKAWIRHNQIDTVLFNEQHWWEPVLCCDRLGITTGAYVVEYTEQSVPFYASYDFLVCNTRQHFDTFKWHPRALYVPWGTDLVQFAPRQWTAVRPEWLTFFHSGGMNPRRKGSDLVVEAFSHVRGPARLVLHVQTGLDDALPGAVARVRELVESGRLTLIEETVPDRAALYHLGDVCVYPSRFDGLGLTVAEALASALPVITTNCAPMNEFIDGTSGKLVDVARRVPHPARSCWPQCVVDQDDLTRQMQSYVDDVSRVEEVRRAARRYAETHLDWGRNALALPDFIGSIQRHATNEQSVALEHVRAFERRRATESVRFWLSYYAPRLVKAVRTMWRASQRSSASSGDHEAELAALLASRDKGRLLPDLPARFHTILDIGCGIGQTLVACDLAADVKAYGVDVDRDALSVGRTLAPRVRFVQARGEQLPFADGAFDVVVSRVALPYMHIPTVLDEIGRVLKRGGYCWLVLHPVSMVRNRLARSVRSGRVKDVIYSMYILANGLLFQWTGRQFRFPLSRRRCESFQTLNGMTRALRARGLDVVRASAESSFVITSVKPER